ncbi:hypothetical protein PO909_007552 [Leuciscus waleckii]
MPHSLGGFLYLGVPLRKPLDSRAEETGWRHRRVEESGSVGLLHVRQCQPQVPLGDGAVRVLAETAIRRKAGRGYRRRIAQQERQRKRRDGRLEARLAEGSSTAQLLRRTARTKEKVLVTLCRAEEASREKH